MSQRPVSSGRRQEHRRRPAGAVGGVAPGDAAQVDGVEQERPDVDIFAATVCRDLLRDHRFCRAGRPPDHRRLAGFDEKGEGRGELARAERVVRGDGGELGHGRAPNGGKTERRGRLSAAGPRPAGRPTPRWGSGCGIAERASRSWSGRRQAASRVVSGRAELPARRPTRIRSSQAPERAAGSWSRSCWRSSIQSRPRTFLPS